MGGQRDGWVCVGWVEGLVGGKVSGLMPELREDGWVSEVVGLWWYPCLRGGGQQWTGEKGWVREGWTHGWVE